MPVVRKKEEIPPIKKKVKKEPPPLVSPHVETKPEETLKGEESLGKQKDLEKSQPQETEEKNLVKAEKRKEAGAPVPGTKASALPLEPSTNPGNLPAFKGATWLGEMSGVAKEGAGGKNTGEGEKPGLEVAVAGKSNPVDSSKEGKGHADLGSYLATARMKIEQAKQYPAGARRKKWEGRVVLSFQINRHGEVLEIKLIQSSGHRLLDDEGIMTLRRASPFPSPLLIEKEKLVLEVPLLFKLEEKK